MTRPAPLYLTEAEIAARLGVSAEYWHSTAGVLERQGLPRRNPMFHDRRYWPAVQRFFDRLEGLIQDGPAARDGPETWDGPRQSKRDRTGRG